MTKFNFKLISFIIFILAIILAYSIYKYMNSYMNSNITVVENFSPAVDPPLEVPLTTRETYDLLQSRFTDGGYILNNDANIAKYDELKIDITQYINEGASLSNSECKQRAAGLISATPP